ncbi:amino acid ABC transporter ATP-binding protein [Olsenella massiliensis]|uniref:amino acid ABC transporter ATP-binding protein n=1 Tax=Olsenella massiliensis TaxID=1622075 RepID=UPI0009EAFC9E|nr:amino acid ABC transporter ATP-binding protein [Olsenella massiliensis]
MTKHAASALKLPRPDQSYASYLGLPAVYVKGARKSFGEREVLGGVDLLINKGEVVSIIGPSGAGKSTLLRCLTLLDRFDEGSLAYGSVMVAKAGDDGSAIYHEEAMQQARMRFGIVFQSFNLFPHLTVMQNVTDAPIVVQGRDREEVSQEARELLRRLDLTEHADKVPCELSGGQQQRAAIARALCMRPQIIYFDEATSALDPKLTADMHTLIRELAQDGMAVGIVTHEMGFAREVSDRVAFLFEGAIVEEGAPEEVIGNPKDERTRAFLANSLD